MKNLVIDPLVHFPTAHKIFYGADYYCEDKEQPIPNGIGMDMHRHINLTHEDIRGTYGIDVKKPAELDTEYDKVFIVFCLNHIDDPGTGVWDPLFDVPDERELTQNYMRYIFSILSNLKYNHLVFLDGHDRPFVSLAEKWLKKEGVEYSAIFKREYRRTHTYDYSNKVFPFPFQTFGEKNPTWRFFEEKTLGGQHVNGCLWAGGPIKHMPPGKRDEWCNRHDMLVAIQEKLSFEPPVSQLEFLNLFNKYTSFLHLNGTGHLCARFFEGLSRGSLMIMEEMDTVFPFDEGEHFAEECVFTYSKEFHEKIDKVLLDKELYGKCLGQQEYILNKYYNYDWINNYVNERL